MSRRKVELDEVTVPSPELESSSSQKSVPVIPTPISEEVNDDDHETSDQVTTEPRKSTSDEDIATLDTKKILHTCIFVR